MKHEIDIFAEIVDNIRDEYAITNFSHVGNVYVFTTENLGDMLVNDYITILGIDCLVTAIDTGLLQFTVVSNSNLEAAQWWKAKKPYFDYEKVLGEANILLEKTNSPVYRLQKYPLVFFALDIEQNREADQISMSDINNLTVYILTSTNHNSKYATWRLENTFKPILIPIYEKLIESFRNHQNIFAKNHLIPHTYTERYFLGTEAQNQNVFNDFVDAIQLNFKSLSLVNLYEGCN